MKPLAIDLCCGMGGWADGLLDCGFDVVGVDIYRHPKYRGELVISDLLELDESRFSGAALVVASPPCDDFARWDKPACWFPQGRPEPSLSLVNRCRDIACALGVPLVLENVRGAQPWLGTAWHHYGPFYLWGDGVPVLLPWCDGRIDKFKNSGWNAATRAKIPIELARAVGEFHAGRIAAGEPRSVRLGFSGCTHETRVMRAQRNRRVLCSGSAAAEPERVTA